MKAIEYESSSTYKYKGNRTEIMMGIIIDLRCHRPFKIDRTSAACQVYAALTCVIFVLTFGRHSSVYYIPS